MSSCLVVKFFVFLFFLVFICFSLSFFLYSSNFLLNSNLRHFSCKKHFHCSVDRLQWNHYRLLVFSIRDSISMPFFFFLFTTCCLQLTFLFKSYFFLHPYSSFLLFDSPFSLFIPSSLLITSFIHLLFPSSILLTFPLIQVSFHFSFIFCPSFIQPSFLSLLFLSLFFSPVLFSSPFPSPYSLILTFPFFNSSLSLSFLLSFFLLFSFPSPHTSLFFYSFIHFYFPPPYPLLFTLPFFSSGAIGIFDSIYGFLPKVC